MLFSSIFFSKQVLFCWSSVHFILRVCGMHLLQYRKGKASHIHEELPLGPPNISHTVIFFIMNLHSHWKAPGKIAKNCFSFLLCKSLNLLRYVFNDSHNKNLTCYIHLINSDLWRVCSHVLGYEFTLYTTFFEIFWWNSYFNGKKLRQKFKAKQWERNCQK